MAARPTGMLDPMDPLVESMRLPEAYGRPSQTLAWDEVRGRLERAEHYWLATVRADGRPHVVPVDAVWLDGAFHFGGHPDTLHQRILRRNPSAAVHLESASHVVIAEGTAQWITPSEALAGRLAAASKEKYGYVASPHAYRAGVWHLRATLVLAWTAIDRDATRFRFAG